MTTSHHTSRNSPPARSSTNAEESSGLVRHVIISPNLACPHRTRPCRWLVTIPSTVGTTDTQQQAAASSSRPPASYWTDMTCMAPNTTLPPILSVKPQIAVKKGREEKELFLSVSLFFVCSCSRSSAPSPGSHTAARTHTLRHPAISCGTEYYTASGRRGRSELAGACSGGLAISLKADDYIQKSRAVGCQGQSAQSSEPSSSPLRCATQVVLAHAYIAPINQSLAKFPRANIGKVVMGYPGLPGPGMKQARNLI